jgi:hypothetical protein
MVFAGNRYLAACNRILRHLASAQGKLKCMGLKDKFDVFQNVEFGKPIFIAQLPNVVIFMYKHPKLKELVLKMELVAWEKLC